MIIMSGITNIKPGLNDIPQGRLGMWILILGEFVIFGGLIVAYLMYRFRCGMG